MTMNYNVTGADRKALVKAIEEATGEKAKYMGMPSAAYQIGGLTVSKTGELTGEYDESLITGLSEAGFEGEGDLPDETAEVDTEEPEETVVESEDEAFDNCSEEDLLGLTVEMPLEKVAVGNLTKLLEAKGSLIKEALGVDDLSYEIREERIAFPWFKTVAPDEARAYTHFIAALCKMAKEAKRVTAKDTPVENPKYAFRCFLLRLGFIGDEYKTDRKILLKNLSGNSSWKNGKGGADDEISE